MNDVARGQKTNRALVRNAAPALDRLKYEVAAEIGVTPPPDNYWGDVPARVNGAIGGNMVRRMIQQAEQQLAGTAPAAPAGQFPQQSPQQPPQARPAQPAR